MQKLEAVLRDLLRIASDKAVIAVASGTAALHALVGALRTEHGELRFAAQAFTFPSCVAQMSASVTDIDAGRGIHLNQVPEEADGIIVTN